MLYLKFSSRKLNLTNNQPYLKNGDWYIYPQFLEHENHKIAHKNAQKSFINFKPRIGNVAITGTNFSSPPPKKKKNMTLCVIGRVRFERNCGKMYSRHLFSYGGLDSGIYVSGIHRPRIENPVPGIRHRVVTRERQRRT